MEHELHFSGARISENAPMMLRGYDPLRELHQWSMLSLLLVSELILVGAASIPMYNSELMLIGAGDLIWGIRPGIIVPFLLLLGLLPFLFRYRSYLSEKRERAKLRQTVLICDTASTKLPSFTVAQKLPLPMQVESRLKKLTTTSSVIGISLLAAIIIINALTFLINSSEILFFFSMIAMIVGVGILFKFGPGIDQDIRLRLAGHYLHPSLTIDEEAITARYGQSTITIAWHDIRYFALVSSATFRGLPGSKTKSPREAFEISDGENAICWLKTEPLSSHRLLRFGKIALSGEDYTAFTQQLAALIMDKTGLPLYDLRLDRHKK